MRKIPRKTRQIIFIVALALFVIAAFAIPQYILDQHQVLILLFGVLPVGLLALWMQLPDK